MLVPFLVTSNYSVAVVGTVLGIMNIVGAMVSTLLPETKGYYTITSLYVQQSLVNNNHHLIMCSSASTGIDLDTTDNISPSDLLSRLSFDRKSDPHCQSSDSIVNSMNNPLMMSQHSGTVSLSDGHL